MGKLLLLAAKTVHSGDGAVNATDHRAEAGAEGTIVCPILRGGVEAAGGGNGLASRVCETLSSGEQQRKLSTPT